MELEILSKWLMVSGKQSYFFWPVFCSVPTSGPQITKPQTWSTLDCSILAIFPPLQWWKLLMHPTSAFALSQSHYIFCLPLSFKRKKISYSPVCCQDQTASWYRHRSPSQRLTTGNMLTIPHAHAVTQFDGFTKNTRMTINMPVFQDSGTKSVKFSHCASLIFFWDLFLYWMW